MDKYDIEKSKFKGALPYDNEWEETPLGHKINQKWMYNFTCDSDLCFENKEEMNKCIMEFQEFITYIYSQYFGKGNYRPWFRGQANVEWEVVPGVLREDFVQSAYSQTIYNKLIGNLLEKERYLMKLFVREGSSYVPKDASPFEWYMLAQHYGMPTRLLDWTDSPLVALWMAVERYADDKDGVIIAMNSSPVQEKKEVVDFWSDERKDELFSIITRSKDAIPESFHEMVKHEAILPISPNLFKGRLVQQHAHFTLHTPANPDQELPYTVGINEFYDCNEFVIKAEYKKFYRTYLLAMGIQRWTLWPDLDNVARGIKEANIVIPTNRS